jgi:transposase
LRQRFEAEGVIPPSAVPEAIAFVPAVIEQSAVPDPAPTRRPRRRRRATGAAVELEIDSVVVKIGRGADAGVIAAVIEALKARR